jgi:hypothetical protein
MYKTFVSTGCARRSVSSGGAWLADLVQLKLQGLCQLHITCKTVAMSGLWCSVPGNGCTVMIHCSFYLLSSEAGTDFIE